jgi:hypothetical protein
LGQSGITVGVGYDVGYVTKDWLHEDWDQVNVPGQFVSKLERACGITGGAAKLLLANFQSVDIPWSAAQDQFDRFVLPRYISETVTALPKSASLGGDCLGALVSLVYNRGASFSRETDRYQEMRAIRRHVDDGSFDLIPAELRSMKRLWEDSNGRPLPQFAGLVYRRELEAKLFEAGRKVAS